MEENENKFEVIFNKNANSDYEKTNGFGKTILLPFISGIAGCKKGISSIFEKYFRTILKRRSRKNC